MQIDNPHINKTYQLGHTISTTHAKIYTACVKLSFYCHWSKKAIKIEEKFTKKVPIQDFNDTSRITTIIYDEKNEKDVKYSCLISEDGYMIVSFRGTMSLKNWKSDFDTELVEHEAVEDFDINLQEENSGWEIVRRLSLNQKGSSARSSSETSTSKTYRLHKGFSKCHEIGLEAITNLIKTNNFKTVIFAGHSLGGAIAYITFLKTVEQQTFPNTQFEVITFGCPKIGDQNCAAYQRKLFTEKASELTLWGRFVHKDDIVTTIPTNFSELVTGEKKLYLTKEREKQIDELLDEVEGDINPGQTLGRTLKALVKEEENDKTDRDKKDNDKKILCRLRSSSEGDMDNDQKYDQKPKETRKNSLTKQQSVIPWSTTSLSKTELKDQIISSKFIEHDKNNENIQNIQKLTSKRTGAVGLIFKSSFIKQNLQHKSETWYEFSHAINYQHLNDLGVINTIEQPRVMIKVNEFTHLPTLVGTSSKDHNLVNYMKRIIELYDAEQLPLLDKMYEAVKSEWMFPCWLMMKLAAKDSVHK